MAVQMTAVYAWPPHCRRARHWVSHPPQLPGAADSFTLSGDSPSTSLGNSCLMQHRPLQYKGICVPLESPKPGSTWVAQLVEQPTLGFGPGHDLRVIRLSPCVRLCTGHGAYIRSSLPLPLPHPIHMHALS